MKDVPESYFLFGPRGTGKTTWLDQRFPESIRISLLDSALRRELRAFPERLKNYIGFDAKDMTVIIDEIQCAPGVLDIIHDLMDKRRNFSEQLPVRIAPSSHCVFRYRHYFILMQYHIPSILETLS